jgi:hypothetical protein
MAVTSLRLAFDDWFHTLVDQLGGLERGNGRLGQRSARSQLVFSIHHAVLPVQREFRKVALRKSEDSLRRRTSSVPD